MITKWLEEIKRTANPEELGVVLIHNGVVRGTSKSGRPVSGMRLSYDKEKLESLITQFRSRPGIVEAKVWVNSGKLQVGDDIMYILVAGRFKTDVLPTLDELLSLVKREIVREEEIP